jgi:predicted esterase
MADRIQLSVTSMQVGATLTCGVLLLALVAPACPAGEASFDGEWRTSNGIFRLKQKDSTVTGNGRGGKITLKGKVDGKKLTFEYREGKSIGDAHWTLDESGHSFHGEFKVRDGERGAWQGWRPDPQARAGKSADLAGLWLTDLGLMEVEMTGDQVKGRYALRGVCEIEGTVTGRRFEFNYKAFRPGRGWFDVSSAGARFAGAAVMNGSPSWYGWKGRRAPEFARHARLIPGKIVDGSTKGLLTYSVRAPEGYKDSDGKKWPTIVILHGSNMNGKAYVSTIASAWPDLARDYLLLGVNGEVPSSITDDPRFNFSYVNFVGRSTYRGFPGTDRESPALVAEALDELRQAYPVARYFVGGHSQGGFLTYTLLMNYPERIAGVFPISAGVIFQCEPTAYTDEKLRAAQRSVPLAIIHGKNDPVVQFSAGEYAAVLFGEAGWPAFRFFADATQAGHRFALLPVAEAVRWLEAHTTDDLARLLDFAERRMKAKGYRDAVAALNRARELKPNAGVVMTRLDRLAGEIDAKAAAGAKHFLPKIRDGGEQGNRWIDDFLAYRDDFEFAPAAREVIQAFDALRAKHNGPAQKALDEARVAFQQGKREEGFARYREIMDRYYAASSYRNVKRWSSDRD